MATTSLPIYGHQAPEPPAPEAVPSAHELFLTGEHLEQYRHPTRLPEAYWNEALRRAPGDARCHVALGRCQLSAGRLRPAEEHFEKKIERLISMHPNPVTREAHYHPGLVRDFLGDTDFAHAFFSKAAWNYEWRSPCCYRLACIDCRHGDCDRAEEHLHTALLTNTDLQQARVLLAALRRLGRPGAAEIMAGVLAVDPLDHAARAEAVELLERHHAARAIPVTVPSLLVFDEDMQSRCEADNHLLAALASHGLGEIFAARVALDRVFTFTLAQPEAVELAS